MSFDMQQDVYNPVVSSCFLLSQCCVFFRWHRIINRLLNALQKAGLLPCCAHIACHGVDAILGLSQCITHKNKQYTETAG